MSRQSSLAHHLLFTTIMIAGAAGFRMTAISEPEPAPAARELFPGQPPRFLAFLFFVLEAV